MKKWGKIANKGNKHKQKTKEKRKLMVISSPVYLMSENNRQRLTKSCLVGCTCIQKIFSDFIYGIFFHPMFFSPKKQDFLVQKTVNARNSRDTKRETEICRF